MAPTILDWGRTTNTWCCSSPGLCSCSIQRTAFRAVGALCLLVQGYPQQG